MTDPDPPSRYRCLHWAWCTNCGRPDRDHTNLKCLYGPDAYTVTPCVLRGPAKPDYDWHACDVHYPLYEDD